MNKVILIGNLTRDPESSQTKSGLAQCRYGIAVNRRRATQSGEPEVDFFNIVCWGGLAENCAKFLQKGRKVGIVGTIQIGSYVNKEGVKQTSVDVLADDVEFLTPKDSDEPPAHVTGGQSYQGNGGAKAKDSAPASQGNPAKKNKISGLTPVDDADLPF